MKKLIYNATIFAEDKKIEKGWILFNDKILDYGEGDPAIMDCEEKMDACGKAVIPGLIDMQANGGGGNLFMDATQEAIENILCTHVLSTPEPGHLASPGIESPPGKGFEG